MSSFFGVVHANEKLIEKIRSITKSNSVYSSEFCTLFWGANSDRLHFDFDDKSELKWIVSGIGISPYPEVELLDKKRWQHAITHQKREIEQLNGHFAGAILEDKSVRLFTDQMGMRSLFLLRKGRSTLFSSRFDWLLHFSSKKIDWETFGENWLSINSFTGDSFISDIERIHSSGLVEIGQTGIRITTKNWTTTRSSIPVETYIDLLNLSLFKKNNQLSLGLSGGLDSRLLLAILNGKQQIDFDLYTFSGIDHPDEHIAYILSKLTDKSHQFFDLSKQGFSFKSLSDIATRSLLNSSISQAFIHPILNKIGLLNKTTIDGGIGELGRRRYLRNLEMRGKPVILNKNLLGLAPFFKAQKADIFNKDINDKMHIGFHNGLELVLNNMPDASTIGIGNWLDLFSIRTRLLNIAGLNQEIVDDLHFHIMPFVQPDFLNAIFSMPENERRNARWYRKSIKNNLIQASKIPLVKGNDSYPFWMNDLTSTLWMKIQKKRGKSFQDILVPNTLLSHKAEVIDLFESRSFRESAWYDFKKIDQLLHSFYTLNDYTVTSSLNWTLCFELFRKRLKNESI